MGVALLPWRITGISPSPLTDITFPINVANAPHKHGYYFAQQFNFSGQGIGYTGLQPQYDASNGTSFIRAVFSTFINGSTLNDPDHCTPGADGGPGVSCAAIFTGTYANTYNLEVRNTEGTTWNGTAIDTVTGRRIHIGSYTLPVGTEGIQHYEFGFVEYFLWTSTCQDLPYTSVVFGEPSTTVGGVGDLHDPLPQGDCTGKDNLQFKKSAQGIEISAGFKSLTLRDFMRPVCSFFDIRSYFPIYIGFPNSFLLHITPCSLYD